MKPWENEQKLLKHQVSRAVDKAREDRRKKESILQDIRIKQRLKGKIRTR